METKISVWKLALSTSAAPRGMSELGHYKLLTAACFLSFFAGATEEILSPIRYVLASLLAPNKIKMDTPARAVVELNRPKQCGKEREK